ncbi:hypothetical protein ACWDX8_17570 [Streptomyces anthocyanicus]|uniref:Uncharacterized protein n=1 Tax=Streptomyces violaceoruber TaxID=1935 RepID=A0ACD4WUI5_STRVN|nr:MULTISPECIES: hypothetical protein [unclassified Streptomyces]WOZ01239.1 hypothetical protein R2E43_28830 [Streptomyces violaceoruber]WTC08174.1 hypothetical protein OHA15_10260 [Streptomyces anthocyanicus]BDD71437.1 hypothetical protein JCM4020_20570 [Streptomyces coelicolor]MDX3371702.1 hypothetical protein [Streptomyces sp. ME02-6987-2C]MDX3424431.1 hypothetical protein [Streptomyces sp. ME02-6985-2c]
MSDSSTLPPARLRPEAELARDALSAPVLARAARLARWADAGTRVDAGGGLVEEQLPAAAEQLGLSGDDAAAHASEAWRIAVDTGLVEITDEEAGTVAAGEDLALLTGGSPQDVLGVWLTALEAVLADASVPDLDGLVDAMAEGGEVDLSSLDWDPEAESDFLDGVLGNLYLLTVGEDGPGEAPVPLPALAASVIVPSDMGEPSNEVLEQVSDAMMRLDDQFRLLEPVGLVEYQPVDEALMADADEEPAAPVDEADVTRYGMVRLTPLGLYGLRARLLDAGFEAPAVGDLSDKGADALLDGTAPFPPAAAHAETELWLAGRSPLDAARELLAAARGTDPGAPLRRLRCQQALSLVGAEAEPALREVLDDAELGGLARVWLTEHGARDVPPPPQEMVFWLTIDTVAAQLAAEGNSEELRALVEGLARQHSGFFDTVWRVEHPATPEVLEAMGRLHPDKKVAKEARKAAFKARSQQGG